MKINLLIATLFVCITGFSQSEKQIREMSASTCECLETKKNDLRKATASELQMEMGICMMGAASKTGYKFDLGDPEGLEALGEKIGLQLAMDCPTFMEMIGSMVEEDPQGMMDLVEENWNHESTIDETTGQLVSVTSGDFVTVKIESELGKMETFYWFGYFEGANLLYNEGAEIKDKKIEIEYETMECYSPKLEDYTRIKVLRGIYIVE